MPSLLHPTVLALIRDDVRLSTWLLIGACVQSLLVCLLPLRLAIFPAACLLTFRVASVLLMVTGTIHDTTRDKVVPGRMTAQFPPGTRREGAEDFVVFIIGARSNHPLSRFAPAFLQAGEYFEDMWKEAEMNREQWGYLGRSSDMLATDEETGNAIITLSYWKSVQHLHEFARSPAHMAGWNWFEKMTKTHPHLSFMHEVYAVPKGCWENVYRNMVPFGMGQTQHVVTSSDGSKDGNALVSGLTAAVGSRWKTMGTRMQWQAKLG